MSGASLPLALALLLAFGAPAAADGVKDHPIAGVIQLLEKLEVQAQQEGATEATTFQKFQYWCKRSTRVLKRAIKKEKKTIIALDDKIGGLAAEIEQFTIDISELDKQLEVLAAQATRAEEMRTADHALFEDEVGNLEGSIVATDEALEVMEEAGEGAALSQLSARHHLRKGSVHKGSPEDLLKQDPSKGNPFKPKAKTFSAHGGGAIETFKGLEEGWSADKLSSEETETNALNAYKLAKQARDNAIDAATDAKREKTSIKGGAESDKATSQSDRDETQRMLEADTLSMDNANKDCREKTEEFEERTKIREGEIEAMKMGQKILSKVSGVRNPDEHVIPAHALNVMSDYVEKVAEDTANYEKATNLLQMGSRVLTPKEKAVNLLRQTAKSLHSQALQKFAEELSTYAGPFDKIKQMIQKMVFRLMAEQKDEDDHKNWCDIETDKSNEKKDDKNDKMDYLKTKIDEMDSMIKLLVKEIVENNDKTDTSTKYIKEETDLRNENHAEIMATVKDSQDAQAALASAIQVLTDFYKKSGMIPKESWELLQTQAAAPKFLQTKSTRDVELPEQPSTWDSSYTGVSDPKNGAEGVLSVLDESMQKFSRMEADAKVQDEVDQKDYEADMNAKKVELEEIAMDTQMKSSRQDTLQEKLEGLATTLKHTTTEHDAVEQYLKDLEPACGTGDSSYEDRKKARADEVEALQKAEGILADAFKGF